MFRIESLKIIKTMKIIKTAALALLAVTMMACGGGEGKVKLLSPADFAKEIDGKKVSIYTLKNKNGMTMQVTNYGTRVVSLWVPDRDGNFRDVVLGMSSLDGYYAADEKFYGATVGRYANRIARGQFDIGYSGYQLDINDGENHLHGGSKGFWNVIWDAKPYVTPGGEEAIQFNYLSKNGEMGYPGDLEVEVRYVLTNNNEFKIFYQARAYNETIVNLSHHSYFNLDGEGAGSIEDHMLRINADNFTPTDSTLIPTGEIAPVAGTPFDFNSFTRIGERINNDDAQLKIAGGYDQNWVVNGTAGMAAVVAEVYSPNSGIYMKVESDEPGIQFYSGNFIKGVDVGKSGKTYGHRSAFCIETQDFPDAPNHPNFPETRLKANRAWNRVCTYTFGVMK